MASARHHRRMSLDDEDDDELFQQLKETLHVHDCVHCGKMTKHAIPCHGHCGHAFYCSTDCLVFHSRTHRHQCLHHRESQASFNSLYDPSDSDDDDEDDLPPHLSNAIDSILRQLRDEAVASL